MSKKRSASRAELCSPLKLLGIIDNDDEWNRLDIEEEDLAGSSASTFVFMNAHITPIAFRSGDYGGCGATSFERCV